MQAKVVNSQHAPSFQSNSCSWFASPSSSICRTFDASLDRRVFLWLPSAAGISSRLLCRHCFYPDDISWPEPDSLSNSCSFFYSKHQISILTLYSVLICSICSAGRSVGFQSKKKKHYRFFNWMRLSTKRGWWINRVNEREIKFSNWELIASVFCDKINIHSRILQGCRKGWMRGRVPST